MKQKITEDLRSILASTTQFACDLYAELATMEVEGNLFFSPYSIAAALAMTYGGARGSTAAEMADVLHFDPSEQSIHADFAALDAQLDQMQEESAVQLYIANSLWPQRDYPFLLSYLNLLKRYYHVSVTPVDYVAATEEARQHINQWVAEETQEKIQQLIREGDIDALTVLVLVNAIYFKGKWASQFDPARTSEADFTCLDGRKHPVQMMHQIGEFGYAVLDDLQMLLMPYVGERMSMVFFLPRTPQALKMWEAQLSPENLTTWLARLAPTEMEVQMPRFEVTWGTFELNQVLINLGMPRAFSGRADFSGMDGTTSLSIGAVLHKAFVEVNEEGTEATAATAVVMGKGLIGRPTFRADHPFVFLIRDNTTGDILFLGRVAELGT